MLPVRSCASIAPDGIGMLTFEARMSQIGDGLDIVRTRHWQEPQMNWRIRESENPRIPKYLPRYPVRGGAVRIYSYLGQSVALHPCTIAVVMSTEMGCESQLLVPNTSMRPLAESATARQQTGNLGNDPKNKIAPTKACKARQGT